MFASLRQSTQFTCKEFHPRLKEIEEDEVGKALGHRSCLSGRSAEKQENQREKSTALEELTL